MTEELNIYDGAVRKFIGDSADTRKDLDPILREIPKAPAIIIHGVEDTQVPYITAQNYVKYAKENYSKEIDLVSLENIGHFEIINP